MDYTDINNFFEFANSRKGHGFAEKVATYLAEGKSVCIIVSDMPYANACLAAELEQAGIDVKKAQTYAAGKCLLSFQPIDKLFPSLRNYIDATGDCTQFNRIMGRVFDEMLIHESAYLLLLKRFETFFERVSKGCSLLASL